MNFSSGWHLCFFFFPFPVTSPGVPQRWCGCHSHTHEPSETPVPCTPCPCCMLWARWARPPSTTRAQLTSSCSFSLSARRGSAAELIDRALAWGLAAPKHAAILWDRGGAVIVSSEGEGMPRNLTEINTKYMPNNQILRVYHTMGCSDLQCNIAFNYPPLPSPLPLNIKKLAVITEAMMIIDWKVF